jgi:hypothetical protein
MDAPSPTTNGTASGVPRRTITLRIAKQVE